jgi:hypothetical protein
VAEVEEVEEEEEEEEEEEAKGDAIKDAKRQAQHN